MSRLVVIDTPLDPSAWGSVPPEADHRVSHAVPYAEWIEGTTTIRAIGVDGLIRTPRGTPPVWEPRRRAAGRFGPDAFQLEFLAGRLTMR